MTTTTLDEVLQKINALTPEEQLLLIALLAQRVRVAHYPARPRRKWRDIRGLAPYPLAEEDAQTWVSRSRREGTESRERQVRLKG